MTDQPYLVIVGGFLGAGKTTLILAAARELSKRGMKSAIILNDQGESLVDTQFVRQSGLRAEEVTGGCFCCQFSSLMERADQIRQHSPDVIFAEPVGSCTDVVGTIFHPLQEAYAKSFRLAPFSVCVDPARAKEIDGRYANPNFAFLFRKQIAEADLVVYTKTDIYPDAPSAPNARYVSAKTGKGVAEWLDEMFFHQANGTMPVGAKVLDIDYAEYARAEAALTWLNMTASIECRPAISPSMLLGPLLDRIAAGLQIVHLKATDHADSGFLKAATCSSREEPQIEGDLDASPAISHEILLNLRAADHTYVAREVVEESMAEVTGRILNHHIDCFSPAPPKPPAWRLSSKA
jgi:Ni2+-binding GTPase involved in maturation of urease and hydrogenase